LIDADLANFGAKRSLYYIFSAAPLLKNTLAPL